MTVRIYTIRANRSLNGPARNSDTVDLMLGLLLIAVLVAGTMRWNSALEMLGIQKLRAPSGAHLRAGIAEGRTSPAAGDDSDLAQSPSPIRVVPARYTEEARAAHFQGPVFVRVYVDAHGVPEDVESTSSIPFGLESSVRKAVSQWRFAPAVSRNGLAVAGKTIIEVPFR